MLRNLIGGQWQAGNGAPLNSINPADSTVLAQGNSASDEDVNRAVAAARLAFPEWQRRGLTARLEIIRKYQNILQERREQLADCISFETGKARWESATEVTTMIGKVDLSIKAYDERTGSKEQQGPAGTTLLQHRPHGVVAVFGPFNFPGHLPNGHIVPALIAGNTVIFKPSEQTPLVAEQMLQCWLDAGIPDGVVNLVHGERETGVALSSHTELDGLFFTGSSSTGAILSQQFAQTPHKILALEMGGNNPLIVSEVANLDAAVYNIIQSAFISAGQRCTCARRLIVIRNQDSAKLLERLVEVASAIVVGAPGEEVFYGPVINNESAERLMAAQQKLLDAGAVALLPMQRHDQSLPYLSPGILNVTSVSNIIDEEHFGPLLKVLEVDSLDEAIFAANDTRFGLAAGLLSDSESDWQQFYVESRAGIVNWNKPTTGASGAAPFGGTGSSGNHRPSAWYAADYCAYPVASVTDPEVAIPEVLSPGLSL